MRGTLFLRDPSYTVEAVSAEKRKSGFVPSAQALILYTPGLSISCSSRRILIFFYVTGECYCPSLCSSHVVAGLSPHRTVE
jgi:hypothetical protein